MGLALTVDPRGGENVIVARPFTGAGGGPVVITVKVDPKNNNRVKLIFDAPSLNIMRAWALAHEGVDIAQWLTGTTDPEDVTRAAS